MAELVVKDNKIHKIIGAEKKWNERLVFYITLACFMLLVFIKNVFGVGIPVFALLLLFVFIALISDKDEMISLIFVCIPYSAAFQYRYGLLALVIIYLIKNPGAIKSVVPFIPVVLMMFWEMLHGLLEYDFSILEAIQSFSNLLTASFILSLADRKFNFKLTTRVFSLSVVVCVSTVLIKLLIDINFNFASLFIDGDYRLGVTEEGASSFALNYNPNGLGIICCMGICAILLRRKIVKTNFIDVASIFLLIVYGFLTLSRTFFLTTILVFVLYLFTRKKSFLSFLRNLVILLVVGYLIYVLLVNLIPYVMENFISRFSEDDITNGRSYLFEIYNNAIFSSFGNFIFGIGMQDINLKVSNMYDNSIVTPHNGFQEIVVAWGVIGLLLFAYWVFIAIRISKSKNKNLKFINFIPLLLVFFTAMGGQLITSGTKLLFMSFAYVVLMTNLEKGSEVDGPL